MPRAENLEQELTCVFLSGLNGSWADLSCCKHRPHVTTIPGTSHPHWEGSSHRPSHCAVLRGCLPGQEVTRWGFGLVDKSLLLGIVW